MNVFSPLALGGLFRHSTIQPITFGEEIAFIRDSSELCLGKIGSGGNICLKLSNECDIEAHARVKGDLPNDPYLVLLKGKEKGYENVVLNAAPLEDSFINELLAKRDLNWPSEFALIDANDATNADDLVIMEDVLLTAKKQKTFATPAKKKSTEEILDKLSMLEVTMNLIHDASVLVISEDGEVLNNFSFDQDAYRSFCETTYEKMEILIENAKSVSDVLLDVQPFILGQTKPIENTVTGLRLEFAAMKALIGKKDLSKKDIPPCVWSAIETGFESCLKLETKLEEVAGMAAEAYEVAESLLTSAEEKTVNKVTFDDDKKPSTTSASFIGSLSKPTIIGGHLYKPKDEHEQPHPPTASGNSGGGSRGGSGGGSSGGDPYHSGGTGCDDDDLMCGRCMTKFHIVDSQITATNVRLSNLEDSKNGNIESAVMIKDRIYRGRADIIAQLDEWFPEAIGRKIDAGLFPTPHLILNLMHADMCSKRAPKIPLDDKDLVRLGIRRSDADAFYALQSDKPEFMTTTDLCPNFNYKATKAQKDAAAIKFLPSHDDYGNGLDSDSLHHMFKMSLDHIRGERERYIEAVLGEHPDHRVLSISKQLLDDSCKFIRQMLGFMEEIYASCYDSFGATTEAWELVTHCVIEVFTKGPFGVVRRGPIVCN